MGKKDHPDKILLPEHPDYKKSEENSNLSENKVITVKQKGGDRMYTPLEALDLVNQVTAVLLAYERNYR